MGTGIMKPIYRAALVGAAIFLFYFIGVYVGGVKCSTRVANANSMAIISNMKIMEKTNEAANHTSVGDIRRILREKYTIAE